MTPVAMQSLSCGGLHGLQFRANIETSGVCHIVQMYGLEEVRFARICMPVCITNLLHFTTISLLQGVKAGRITNLASLPLLSVFWKMALAEPHLPACSSSATHD